MQRALMALLAVLCLTGTAAAQNTKKLQVLAIMSNTAFTEADALTVALKRAVDREDGWSLSKGDFSLEVMVIALKCSEPPDTACLQKVAKKVNTKQFVWGTMEKAGSEVVVHLRLWDGTARAESKLQYPANLNDASDEALLKIASTSLGELIGTARGKLVITVGTPGMLSIDGQPPKPVEGRVEFPLAAGEHEVRLTAEGRATATRTVKIVAGETNEIELSPAATPGPRVDTKPAADTNPKNKSPRQLYGYIGLGTGAAFVVGGIFSALKVDSVNSDSGFDAYRRGLGPNQDACDEAATGRTVAGAPAPDAISEKCDSGKLFQTLEFVFFGLGALSAGAGAYFLLSEDPEADQAKPLTPRIRTAIGPQGGRVNLSVNF